MKHTTRTEKVCTSNKENTYNKAFPQFSLLQQWRHRNTENKMTFNILWNTCIGLQIVLNIMLGVLNKRWYWRQYIDNIHFLQEISYDENKCNLNNSIFTYNRKVIYKINVRCEIKIFLKEVHELWMLFKTAIFICLLLEKKIS